MLLEKLSPAQVNYVDEEGFTALMLAVLLDKLDKIDTVAMLLKKLSPEEVNYANEQGRTALMLAALGDKPAIVAMLLEKLSPAQVNYVDQEGFTALMRAFLSDRPKISEMCFAAGGMLPNNCWPALDGRPQRRLLLLRSLSAFHLGRFDVAVSRAERNQQHRAFCLNPLAEADALPEADASPEVEAFHAFLGAFSGDAALTETPQAAIELSQPQQAAVLGLSPKHFLAYAAKPNFLVSDIIDRIKDRLPPRLVSKAFNAAFCFSLKRELLSMLDDGQVVEGCAHPVVSLLCQETPPHSSMNFVPASSQSSGHESPLRHLPPGMATRIAAFL